MHQFGMMRSNFIHYRYIIKAKDYKGYNALHFAAKELDYKLIHVLLRAQARELRMSILNSMECGLSESVFNIYFLSQLCPPSLNKVCTLCNLQGQI